MAEYIWWPKIDGLLYYDHNKVATHTMNIFKGTQLHVPTQISHMNNISIPTSVASFDTISPTLVFTTH